MEASTACFAPDGTSTVLTGKPATRPGSSSSRAGVEQINGSANFDLPNIDPSIVDLNNQVDRRRSTSNIPRRDERSVLRNVYRVRSGKSHIPVDSTAGVPPR